MTTRQAIPIVAKAECVEPAGSCAGLAPNITRTWWGRVLASAQYIPTGATVPLGIAVLAVGLLAVGLLGYERLATGALLCVSAGVLLWLLWPCRPPPWCHWPGPFPCHMRNLQHKCAPDNTRAQRVPTWLEF